MLFFRRFPLFWKKKRDCIAEETALFAYNAAVVWSVFASETIWAFRLVTAKTKASRSNSERSPRTSRMAEPRSFGFFWKCFIYVY